MKVNCCHRARRGVAANTVTARPWRWAAVVQCQAMFCASLARRCFNRARIGKEGTERGLWSIPVYVCDVVLAAFRALTAGIGARWRQQMLSGRWDAARLCDLTRSRKGTWEWRGEVVSPGLNPQSILTEPYPLGANWRPKPLPPPSCQVSSAPSTSPAFLQVLLVTSDKSNLIMLLSCNVQCSFIFLSCYQLLGKEREMEVGCGGERKGLMWH